MRAASLCLLVLLPLAACEKQSEPPVPASKAAAVKVALDGGAIPLDASAGAEGSSPVVDAGPALEFVGTVSGVVKLAKGAQLPLAPMPSRDGTLPPSVAPCPPVDNADRKVVTRAKETGGLSPVHLAITGMRQAPQREPVEHELYIDACRLRPTLVGAMRGDTVRVTNRSESALLPVLPGDKFMRGLLRGEQREGVLQQTQTKVQCSFGSYCGESMVIATTHPLYAVTTPEGFFTIERVPLDQDLKIHAWHPLFNITSAPFRLTADKRETMIELTLTPRPATAPPPKVSKGGTKAPARDPNDPKVSGPAFE